jgi:oligopeptide/dipeptide ABC transporter ATP-binding protein
LILVAHDLMVVRHTCDRVMVMYSSQVVEEGPVAEVFSDPRHPYTKALIDAIPTLGDEISLESIEGQAPDITEDVAGCRFAARCRYVRELCRTVPPDLTSRASGRAARCFGTEPGGWIGTWQ